jgi:phage gp29-like protein
MADFKNILRTLTGRKQKDAQKVMETHTMSPVIVGGTTGDQTYTLDELAYMGINPFEQTQDVYPVSSSSAAHGYLYIQSRNLFDLLDEMVDRDTVIGGCLELIVAYMLMRPQGLTLKEEDANKPGAKEALELVQKMLIDQTNWSYLLWSLSDGLLRHGRATAEITWEATADGYYKPRKFYHCHPGQFTFDRDGNMYLSIAPGKDVHEPLTPLKFVTVARPAMYDNPWGSSLIYPLRFVYHFKKKAMIFRLRYADKNGEPIYIAKVSSNMDAAPDPAASQAKLVAGLSSIGTNNFMVLGAGENVEVNSRPAGSGGGELHKQIAEDYDKYMTTRLLGATLTTGTEKNGNRALGEVHDKTMLNRILPPSQLLCAALNAMIIDPFCDLNLPPGSPRPYYYIDTEESTDAAEARETLLTAVKCGLQVAVAEARERLGYREPVENEPVIGGEGFNPVARDVTIDDTPVPTPTRVAATETNRGSLSHFTSPPSATAPTSPETPSGAVAMASHDYGCVMLPVEEIHAAEVEAWARENIDEEDLTETGIVTDPHITVLYGITDDDPKPVKQALLGLFPPWVSYGALKLFQNDEADVLYVEVNDVFEDVAKMRGEVIKYVSRDESVDKSKDGYTPHVTVAYLKPGRGSKYTVSVDEDGQPTDYPVHGPLAYDLGILDRVVFSTQNDDVQYEYPLTGPYAEFNPDRAVLPNLAEPTYEGEVLPTAMSAAFARLLVRHGTSEQFQQNLRILFTHVCDRSTKQYAQLYRELNNVQAMWKMMADAQQASRAVMLHANDQPLTVQRWRETDSLRHAEFTRAVTEQAAMEERQEQMAQKLTAETRDALFKMVRNTARNIDALWHDNDAPLSIRAYNAIDLDPLVDAADNAASLTVYGTFLLALGYTSNVKDAVAAAKEERKPKFWNVPEATLNFEEGDGFSFEGWSTAYGDAADWMISRGVLTLEQVHYIAGLMASQSGGDRDEIERGLRDHYFALARTVDVGATKKVQTLIANAVGRGETVSQFLNSIDAQLGVGALPGGLDGYWENVWRTEVANAYSQQQQQQEADPAFQDVLWGHLGGNPNDKRSDPTHARFNGVYYKKGSQASQMLGRTPFRYRCRCYMTPLVDADPEDSDYTESANAFSVAAGLTRF